MTAGPGSHPKGPAAAGESVPAGTVALVTGAARGVGRATARALASAGAAVVVNYRSSEAEAEALVAELRGWGRHALAARADVGAWREAEGLVGRVLEAFGRLDVLVHNAGAEPPLDPSGPSEAAWGEALRTNLLAAFYLVRAAERALRRAGPGRVVHVASVAGLIGFPPAPHYGAAKAGLLALTKSQALALAPDVLVNAVAPGWLDTGFAGGWTPDEARAISASIPLGRFGTPEEVARLIRFLAMENGYVTGQTIAIDGGVLLE